MDEVDTKKTIEVLSLLKRFSDPTNFLPTSKDVTFDQDAILMSSIWGGCIYLGTDSFLLSDSPVGITTLMINDLSTLLQARKSQKLTTKMDETSVTFSVGKAKLTYARTAGKPPWDYTEMLSAPLIELPKTIDLMKTLRDLSFSISDNAYKSQFGGVWYSESDQSIYASDNARITKYPLPEKLGFGENFFVPAVFLKKLPSFNERLLGISNAGGVFLFIYETFAAFFLVRDVKMPTFSTAFTTASEQARQSGVNFKLSSLSDDDREEFRALRPLFLNEDGESSDVSLVSEGDRLRIEIIHKQKASSRGFVDYLPLESITGVVDIRMHSVFFLDALERFNTFYLDEGKALFVCEDGNPMSQLIAWKAKS